jgi:GT2 family glycosyltransferase
MITTRNRCGELARTCAILEQLDPPPHEILVYADGCTDGTAELLRGKGPLYRVFTSEAGRGSIPNRDFMARVASADVILSLDDDSYPLETDAIGRIRALFAGDAKLAIASFPQRSDEYPGSLAETDFGPALRLGSYASSSAALRRSTYVEVGGYETMFGHVYEEPDFALRCVAAGYEVRFEPVLTVRHHYSGEQRREIRIHHLQARNELWSVILRCPWPWLPFVALFRALRQFGYACRRGFGWVLQEPRWWPQALQGLPAAWRARQAVPWSRYLAWMQLLRRPTEVRHSDPPGVRSMAITRE